MNKIWLFGASICMVLALGSCKPKQKIVYLLQNPKEAKRLGKNGRKRYLEKYSSEVFGKNMIAFYKSLFQECK